MIGGHRTTTAATVRKLKMHTAIFNFRLRNINSKVKGHNAHYLLLYKPGWGRTKRTANSLQSKPQVVGIDRKSTRLNSSHQIISYAVFCLKKKKNTKRTLH